MTTQVTGYHSTNNTSNTMRKYKTCLQEAVNNFSATSKDKHSSFYTIMKKNMMMKEHFNRQDSEIQSPKEKLDHMKTENQQFMFIEMKDKTHTVELDMEMEAIMIAAADGDDTLDVDTIRNNNVTIT